jgi:hypothetical protein
MVRQGATIMSQKPNSAHYRRPVLDCVPITRHNDVGCLDGAPLGVVVGAVDDESFQERLQQAADLHVSA